MPRRFEPVANDLVEFLGCHAGVRSGNDFGQSLFARCHDALDIASQHGLVRPLLLPLGMLGGHRLDAIEREGKLKVIRLFAPQRAVVVEHGNPLGRRNIVRAAFLDDARDELHQRCLRRPFVP
jgi:hypothetical protein